MDEQFKQTLSLRHTYRILYGDNENLSVPRSHIIKHNEFRKR